jgi:hypothetical protein
MDFQPLQAADLGLPNDPSRPVMFALSRAFLQNFNAALLSISEAVALASPDPGKADESQIIRSINNAIPCLQNVGELSDWMYPPRTPVTLMEAVEKAQELRQWGAEREDIEPLIVELQKRPAGRPHKRQWFVLAFEFQLQSSANSQGKAVRNFCPCAGNAHSANCEQNLKAGLRSLKKVLRKYAPELASQYESLHPNRARKVNG